MHNIYKFNLLFLVPLLNANSCGNTSKYNKKVQETTQQNSTIDQTGTIQSIPVNNQTTQDPSITTQPKSIAKLSAEGMAPAEVEKKNHNQKQKQTKDPDKDYMNESKLLNEYTSKNSKKKQDNDNGYSNPDENTSLPIASLDNTAIDLPQSIAELTPKKAKESLTQVPTESLGIHPNADALDDPLNATIQKEHTTKDPLTAPSGSSPNLDVIQSGNNSSKVNWKQIVKAKCKRITKSATKNRR